MAAEDLTSIVESDISKNDQPSPERPSGWLQVGAVAAASALAGGLAAAWYYRKTLARLRQVEAGLQDSEHGMPIGGPPEED